MIPINIHIGSSIPAVLSLMAASGIGVPRARGTLIRRLEDLFNSSIDPPKLNSNTTLLRATRLLTRDEREVKKASARAVFNVLFHNRDDHPKNFAWRLGRDRRWRLAPAFDLTFSEGPMGRHHMDVCGEDRAVERGHLLRLASEGGVATKAAEATIDRMVTQAATFPQRAAAYPIRRATVQQMKASVHDCRGRLMRD